MLSTSHDSLSLVDDESICEDIEDVKLDTEVSTTTAPAPLTVSNILKTQNFSDFTCVDDTRNFLKTPNVSSNRSKTGNKGQSKVSTLNDENAALHIQIPNQQQHILESPCNSSNNQKVLITSCCSHAEKNCPTLMTQHMPNTLFTPTYPASNSTAASPLTTSKSENNIFDKHNLSISSYTTNFEVVNSLSDLSDDLNYYERDSMPNDLSRPQILNQFSDDDLNDTDDNFHRF